MLPGELDWVLDLLGFEWPNIDEDLLFQAAQEWRDFAQAVSEYQEQGNTAASLVVSAHVGDAADAFMKEWGKFADNGLGIGGHGIGYLDGLTGAGEVLAGMLEICAIAVIALKIFVIVQLIDLAIEFAIAQASAPVTLGASEAALAGRVVMIRMLVKRALTEAAQKIEEAVIKAVKERVVVKAKDMAVDLAKDIGKKVAGELASQGIKASFGAGGSWGENLTSLGVAAANPVLGKVAGEIKEDDDGSGYHFETKAGGKVVEGAIGVAQGDSEGLSKMAQGSGELFNNFTEKKGEETGSGTTPESGEGSGSGSGEGSSGGSGEGSGGGTTSGSGTSESGGATATSESGGGGTTTTSESGGGTTEGSGEGTSQESGNGTSQETAAQAPPEPRQGSATSAEGVPEDDRVRTVFG
ncbi:WXG100-like domain-containing protein [Streptomyces sp. SDT5-1]|uniref:WXG100-like domain-containing protein n=1 Tax=Streptomyces sp. SDT5-1 TaxID=3406418 RepID=UPI003FD27840